MTALLIFAVFAVAVSMFVMHVMVIDFNTKISALRVEFDEGKPSDKRKEAIQKEYLELVNVFEKQNLESGIYYTQIAFYLGVALALGSLFMSVDKYGNAVVPLPLMGDE